MHDFNLSVLFLAGTGVTIAIAAVAAVIALVLGAVLALSFYKKSTEKKIGSANERVEKIISDAEKEAERIKAQGKEESKHVLKEALLEAKEQDLKLRNEFERETKEKKAEIQRMEQRLTQKEDAIDKKSEALEQSLPTMPSMRVRICCMPCAQGLSGRYISLAWVFRLMYTGSGCRIYSWVCSVWRARSRRSFLPGC